MRKFLKSARGQDLSEYCLLMAFVALVAVAIIINMSGGIQNLWNSTATTLQAGASAATGSAGGSGHPAGGDGGDRGDSGH